MKQIMGEKPLDYSIISKLSKYNGFDSVTLPDMIAALGLLVADIEEATPPDLAELTKPDAYVRL
jgi:hypothetical protein